MKVEECTMGRTNPINNHPTKVEVEEGELKTGYVGWRQ